MILATSLVSQGSALWRSSRGGPGADRHVDGQHLVCNGYQRLRPRSDRVYLSRRGGMASPTGPARGGEWSILSSS